MDTPLSKNLFSADGNAPDPEGGDLRGLDTGVELGNSALGHPELIYIARDGREVTFFADAFDDHLHLHCPFCRLAGAEHGLMVRQGVREWLYEPLVQAPAFPGWDSIRMLISYPKGTGGRLQLAPLTCPWCKTKFAITNNVVRPE
jgi:hypothetical protein